MGQRQLLISQQDSQLLGEILADNNVTDDNIRSAIVIDVALAAFLLLAFCVLQRSSLLYRYRLVSPSVTYKPRDLPNKGWLAVFGWIANTLRTSDRELLTSCGLDALMMVKASTLGVQLFLPLTVVGLCVFLPIHAYGGIEAPTENTSRYLRFTMSNLPLHSSLYWVHVVVTHVYVVYACWLLKWHYHQYLIIRVHFLKKGEDVNMWRMLYDSDQPYDNRFSPTGLLDFIPLLNRLAPHRVTTSSNGEVDWTGQDGVPTPCRPMSLPGDTMRAGPGTISKPTDGYLLRFSEQGAAPARPPAALVAAGPPAQLKLLHTKPYPELHIMGGEEQDDTGTPASIAQLLPKSSAYQDSSTAIEMQTIPTSMAGRTQQAVASDAAASTVASATVVIGAGRVVVPRLRLADDAGHERTTAMGPSPTGALSMTPSVASSHEPLLRGSARQLGMTMSPRASGKPTGLPGSPTAAAAAAGPRSSGAGIAGGPAWAGSDRITGMQARLAASSNLDERRKRAERFSRLIQEEVGASVGVMSGSRQNTETGAVASKPAPPPPGSHAVVIDARAITQAPVPPAAASKAGHAAPASTAHASQGATDNLTDTAGCSDRTSKNGVPTKVQDPLESLYTTVTTPAPTQSQPALIQLPVCSQDQVPLPHLQPASAVFHEHSQRPVQPVSAPVAPARDQPPQLQFTASIPSSSSGGAGTGTGGRTTPDIPSPFANPSNAMRAYGPMLESNIVRPASSRRHRRVPSEGAELLPLSMLHHIPGTTPPRHRRMPSEGVENMDAGVYRRTRAGTLSFGGLGPLTEGGASSRTTSAFRGAGFQRLEYIDNAPIGMKASRATDSASPDVVPTVPSSASAGGAPDELLDQVPRWWGKVVLKSDLILLPSTASTPRHTHSVSQGGPSAAMEAAGSIRTPGGSTPAALTPRGSHRRNNSTPSVLENMVLDMDGMQTHMDGTQTPPRQPSISRPSPLPTAWSRRQLAHESLWSDAQGEMADADEACQQLDLLAMPSVRARKTINAIASSGEAIGVNAQDYVVLVTDVQQPLYPERQASQPSFLKRVLSGKSGRRIAHDTSSKWSHSDSASVRVGLSARPSLQQRQPVQPAMARSAGRSKARNWPANASHAVEGSARSSSQIEVLLQRDGNSSSGALNQSARLSSGGGLLNSMISLRFSGIIAKQPGNDSLATSPPAPAPSFELPSAAFSPTLASQLTQHAQQVANPLASSWEGLPVPLPLPSLAGYVDQPSTPAAVPAAVQQQGMSVDAGLLPTDNLENNSNTNNNQSGDVNHNSNGDNNNSNVISNSNDETITSAAGDPQAGGGEMQQTRAEAVSRAQQHWCTVRRLVKSGAVRLLPNCREYSVVTSTFKRLFPNDYERAIPVIRHKTVDLLLRKQDLHLAAYEQAKLYHEKTGQRLMQRMKWFTKKIDCMDFHREQLAQLKDDVRKARAKALTEEATPSWFVFFKSQTAATIATAAPLHAEDNRQFKVHPAPGPEEVNWGTLWLTWRSREIRSLLVPPLMLLLVLIPIGIFTGGLQQLDLLFCPVHKCSFANPGKLAPTIKVLDPDTCRQQGGTVVGQTWDWSWYCQQGPLAHLLSLVVVAWAPALLLVVWQGGLLPLGLYLLTQMSGRCQSLSAVDKHIATYFFYFAVFNVFLGGMAGSAIVTSFTELFRKGPLEVFLLVGTTLPGSSNFFLNYLLFRTLVGIPCRLVVPHVGVRLFLMRRYLRCVRVLTERDRAVLYAPVSPRYGFEYGMVIIIFLIGCAFSVVAPLLLPLVLGYFGLSWLFWRYSLLYVYVRKYESGGMMWPYIFQRVVLCLYIMSLFTACVLLAKQAYVQASILFFTIPLILYRFSRHCWFRFQLGVNRMPLEYAHAAPKAKVDPWVYIPAPLHHRALGWHPDWNKPWQGWDMPPGYSTL